MKKEDILYICSNLSNLFGIPVRVYINKKLDTTFSLINLVKDPFNLHLDLLDKESKNISYYATKDTFCYAILKSNEYQIVIGPFRYFPANKQIIMDLAFQLDINKEDINSFVSAIKSITCMPLETVLQSLCPTNFILNHEKLDLEDILIKEEIKDNKINTPLINEEEKPITDERNSTLKIEETLQTFVEKGDIEGFKSWIKKSPAIRAGSMTHDILRQSKNTFIVSATLFSRAAIRGGLEYNQALDLTDEYIRKVEEARSQNEISNLSYQMIMDFITRVNHIKRGNSPLQSKIASYVYTHLSDSISLDDLCDYLYMSKPNLCLRFKKESGQTINNFILKIKIDECKNLLKTSDKSLSAISLYLGFSSPSHLTKVFKSIEGITPIQYKMGL